MGSKEAKTGQFVFVNYDLIIPLVIRNSYGRYTTINYPRHRRKIFLILDLSNGYQSSSGKKGRETSSINKCLFTGDFYQPTILIIVSKFY